MGKGERAREINSNLEGGWGSQRETLKIGLVRVCACVRACVRACVCVCVCVCMCASFLCESFGGNTHTTTTTTKATTTTRTTKATTTVQCTQCTRWNSQIKYLRFVSSHFFFWSISIRQILNNTTKEPPVTTLIIIAVMILPALLWTRTKVHFLVSIIGSNGSRLYLYNKPWTAITILRVAFTEHALHLHRVYGLNTRLTTPEGLGDPLLILNRSDSPHWPLKPAIRFPSRHRSYLHDTTRQITLRCFFD